MSRHKIWTIADIAKLEPEVRQRLIAELPDIIETVANTLESFQALAQSMPTEEQAPFLAGAENAIKDGLTWIDDGQTNMQIRVRLHDETGKEHLKISGDSRTRDFAFIEGGEDKSYDVMLFHRMRKAGIVINDDNIAAILPEGQVVLDAESARRIEQIYGVKDFADMAEAAQRKIILVGINPDTIAKDWQDIADIQ